MKITPNILINESEIKFTSIRSPGPGGQNVNKVATAVELRFDVLHSASLSEDVRARLSSLVGKKITLQGELIIKATRHRTQERNKQDALGRFKDLLKRSANPPKRRKKTKPSLASTERRLTKKKLHSKIKYLRSKRNHSF